MDLARSSGERPLGNVIHCVLVLPIDSHCAFADVVTLWLCRPEQGGECRIIHSTSMGKAFKVKFWLRISQKYMKREYLCKN